LIPKAIFYWIVSLSGLAAASFMYSNVVRKYHKNKLKPMTGSIMAFFFLLGGFLYIFNHFLSLALSGISNGLDLGIRIAFVLILSWIAWFVFKRTKLTET
jgi:ABC-type Co2+ transport system permease subunit